MTLSIRCLLMLCTLAQGLGGCVSVPMPGLASQAVPEAFREPEPPSATEAAAAPAALPAGGWWQVFEDPQLDALIEQLPLQNTSLQQAAARVAQAAASARAAGAVAQPHLATSMAAGRQLGPLVNAAGDQGSLFNASLNLQYEVDLLQRLSRGERAAGYDLQAQQALQRQLLLLAQADLVQHYLAWRAVQIEQGLVDALIATQGEQVAWAQRRRHAGLAAAQAVSTAQAELRTLQADAQQLQRRRATLLHAMAWLVADVQGLPTLDSTPARAMPSQPVIPPGLPSRMLQRRADVAAADQALQAARLRLGLARDAWFPSLVLTANAGLVSGELSQWLRAAARSAGLGLLLQLPGLDGGRRDAAREQAAAALDLAAAEHRERVLGALRDVDDQLAALRTLSAEAALQQAGVAAATRDAERARSLRERGLVADDAALQAGRQALAQRRTLLQIQAAQRLATVGLVRALGGGWDAPAAPATTSSAAAPSARAPGPQVAVAPAGPGAARHP